MPVRYGLIEPEELPIPALPPEFEGLRIAHLSDIHIVRSARTLRRVQRLANQLAAIRLDLVFLTGDYMNEPGDEDVATEAMLRLIDSLRPSIGSFGVFGNHDSQELCDRLAGGGVTWLFNTVHRLPGTPIELQGMHNLRHIAPDPVALAIDRAAAPPVRPERPGAQRASDRPVRLLLVHSPSSITSAADMGVDVMFSGHTHGGQIRLPLPWGGQPLVNACDLPLRLTSGLIRHRNTLGAISRGLGEVGTPRHRFWCRPQAPVYTLRRRSLPGRYCETVEMLRFW